MTSIENTEALIEAWSIHAGTHFRLRGYGPDYVAAGQPEPLVGTLDDAIERNGTISVPVEGSENGVLVKATAFVVEL